MPTDPAIIAALVSAVVAIVIAIITSVISANLQKDRLRTELKLEFSTEVAIRELLSNDRWKLRSFDAIHRRFQGFEADELRKMLIRVGALSFEGQDGKELWGLRERNRDQLT